MAHETSAAQDVHVHLRAIAEFLRQPHRLDAVAQGALADLVEELDQALKQGAIPDDEAARLAAMAEQFAQAVHQAEAPNILQAARARLEAAAVAAENSAPMAASLARRFMDALANVGI